jgi:DNA-binding LacI/PurR family transcriptional regulator
MNFRPNRLARSLAIGRTNVIGVVPPSLGFDLLDSPFMQRAMNAVINEAERHSRDLMFFTATDRMASESLGQELVDGRIDGALLIAPAQEAAIFKQLDDAGLPYAVACSSDPNHGPNFYTDNIEGTRLGLDHLIGLGHRRIAYISGRLGQVDGAERLKAFQELALERGLVVPPEYIGCGNFVRETARDSARRILQASPPPTAIMCANDDSAAGVYDAIYEAGLRIPEDISVVGFDDSPSCDLWRPPLTTTKQPIDLIVARSMRALLDRIEGCPTEPTSLAPSFIVRHSTSNSKESSHL